MAETETFYPKTIKPDYTSRPTPTSTGNKASYQAMKGANNLKKLKKNQKGNIVYDKNGVAEPSSDIAYWGDRFPDKTHSQNPLRYYPNTVTTFSGSWNIPSPFTVTEWNIPKTIADDSIVTKIVVEYAITHVQYQNAHVENAGWAYNSEGCKFYKSELGSAANVRAENGSVAGNSETSYAIKLTNFGSTASVSGNGLKYSQRTTSNLDTYSSMNSYNATIYSGNNKKLNIGKLRNADLRFIFPRNLNWDIGRVVMKYVRIKVSYTPIDPIFAIDSLTVSPSSLTTCPNSKAKVTVKIKSTNGHTGNVNVKLSGNGITSAIITKVSDSSNFKNHIWTAKKFSKGIATLTFYVQYSKAKIYTIKAKVQNSEKSKNVKVVSCQPNFDFTLVKDEKDGDKHTPGDLFDYNKTYFEFFDYDNKSGFFKIHYSKDATNNDNESIVVDTGGLKIEKWIKEDGTQASNISQKDTYLWEISKVNKETEIILYGLANFNIAGTYAVVATYTNLTHPSFNAKKKYEIIVKGTKLGKEYFKMRLEDGSDVRYNSLMFTKGDDLKIPLTYTTEDIYDYTDDMIIIGGQKRIPVGEIQYIDFNITLNTEEDIELKNVLTYIEAISDGNKCNDIIVGSSKNVKLMGDEDDEKVCVIKSIKSKENTKISFAVQSDIEQECFLYIKPYNVKTPYTYTDEDKTYTHDLSNGEASVDTSKLKPGHYYLKINYSGDKNNERFISKSYHIYLPKNNTIESMSISNETLGLSSNVTGQLTITVPSKKWKPAHVYFKDIPNIKIWIEGVKEIDTSIEDKFSLYYHIQNLSDVKGKNVRFQIKEPYSFKKLGYSFYQHTADNEYNIENGRNKTSPWFNENNRIITFPILETQDIQQDYRLRIDYQATQKGIYDFIIKTLDDVNSLDDDQYENSYTHKLLVDIPSDVIITTNVSKKLPYVNELIDFHINVKNRFKDQKQFTFDIYDIGRYDPTHTINDYEVQPYQDCSYGTFTINNNRKENNKIGTWVLEDIKANTEYDLTITLKPESPGTHVIQTIFYDGNEGSATQDFEDKVKVLTRKKQIGFNVYQAVDDDDNDCSDCNKLSQICDDDFINLKDKIYYVFEIQNNNRNPIENNIYVYARLPESFLENGILCQSRISNLDKDSNLLSFTIPRLEGCEDKVNSKVKFCIKLEPNDIGNFVSNFSLVTRNADIINKQLKLTVDNEFNERKLEHEINIYNFDKTNKYYRYEIDNTGQIFKYFNTGDKSVRLIDHEQHNESSIETYRGTNLRRIIKDIKENSKYVDPVFLKEGTNKLNDKGYELYPDSLIKRFGLLKSEVFHYSHQLPSTSNLVEKAMKWDIDNWDTKVWAGDIYDNGVFDLTIDYAKVPSNFNILDAEYPIKNLQNLVDKAKPYGTKAICYYSATVHLKMKMFVDAINTMTNYYIKLSFKIPEDKVGVISEYSRHDKSLAIYYDMFKLHFNTAIKDVKIDADNVLNKTTDTDNPTITPNIKDVGTVIYETKTDKSYTQDCYDIISNIYSTREKNNNIDIIKPYNNDDFTENTDYFKQQPYAANLVKQQIIDFVVNLKDEELTNLENQNTIILANNQSIGLKVEEDKTSTIYTYNPHFSDGIITVQDKNDILFIFERNDIEYFTGFKVIIEGEVVESYNIVESIDKVSMQIQLCKYDDYNVLHFWGRINDNNYYHIGHLLSTGITQPTVKVANDLTDNLIKSDKITAYSCDVDNKIVFKLSDNVNVIKKDFDYLESMERRNKWNYLKNINKGKGKYASFKNDINIDSACDTENKETMEVPKLILKYNDIPLDDTDEIVDIAFKIKADSNKDDFAENININLYKDGDYYIPENNIASKIYYPSQVTNATQEFLATMQLELPNITMCSNCLKTSLGYYDECPHCNSTNVYHTNEKMSATVCHNCGYITKGWHDNCTYCLSYDIDKVKIDYNKTYCTECHTLTDDYYNHCPHCFSSKVIHLSNNKKAYRIFGENKQNIDPINISITEDRVNVFNLEIPFNNKTEVISKDVLEYINLNIHGTNNNDGKYYYCESCGTGGLGHYDNCPNCSSKLIHNNTINDYVIDIYYQNLNGIQSIGIEPIYPDFKTQVELQDISLKNLYDSFSLIFYIENQAYTSIYDTIEKLPIDDESKGDIIDGLMKMDISIDNLSLDYKYKNQEEWDGLNNLYQGNHTGITYTTTYNKNTTDNISFSDFDIPIKKYDHAYLHLHGIVKNTDNYKINLKIRNNNKIYNHVSTSMNSDIFNYQIDLNDIIKDAIHNPEITVFFTDVQPESKITILECDILTKEEQYKSTIHDNINDVSASVAKDNGYILLSSIDKNIWGLNDTKPYYLSGRQLNTNLIGYIDFGTLSLEEYIKVYTIEMIVLYKNKIGQIITENIPVKDFKNTENLNSNAVVTDDGLYPEQGINGNIECTNGEAWLSLKYSTKILNNLEYEVNINTDDEILNAIPLRNKVAQSFTIPSSDINQISVACYKQRGYPSDIVDVYLCKDNNNSPGSIIRANKTKVDTISKVIYINLDTNDLVVNQKYWFVIEDIHANKNNYHQFKYNDNTEVGQLIQYENDKAIYDTNSVLSFDIYNNKDIKDFYDLPTFWSIDINEENDDKYGIYKTLEYDSYKMFVTFYRYNIQNNSNISASDLHIINGYKIKENIEDNINEA